VTDGGDFHQPLADIDELASNVGGLRHRLDEARAKRLVAVYASCFTASAWWRIKSSRAWLGARDLGSVLDTRGAGPRRPDAERKQTAT
jgi:hypothetical protein